MLVTSAGASTRIEGSKLTDSEVEKLLRGFNIKKFKTQDEQEAWRVKAVKEGDVHPLLIIANFVFEFLAIHPFQDGNGRLSRVLTNFLLLKAGYDYVPYVSHEQLVEANN